MTRSALVTGSLVGWLLVAGACNRQEAPPAPAGSAPAAAPASAAPAAAAGGAALAGLDPCLVGGWKTTNVTLEVDEVKANGGAGMTMQIAPNGAAVIDFGRMSDIRAKSPALNFDFKYSGKATGTLATPSQGTLRAERTDFGDLRVTAKVKLPGAGSLPLFKDTPVAELVKMAEGIGSAAKTGAAPPPGAAGAGKPQGIDPAPVFSSNRYGCSPGQLTLQGSELNVSWSFVRDKA